MAPPLSFSCSCSYFKADMEPFGVGLENQPDASAILDFMTHDGEAFWTLNVTGEHVAHGAHVWRRERRREGGAAVPDPHQHLDLLVPPCAKGTVNMTAAKIVYGNPDVYAEEGESTRPAAARIGWHPALLPNITTPAPPPLCHLPPAGMSSQSTHTTSLCPSPHPLPNSGHFLRRRCSLQRRHRPGR